MIKSMTLYRWKCSSHHALSSGAKHFKIGPSSAEKDAIRVDYRDIMIFMIIAVIFAQNAFFSALDGLILKQLAPLEREL